jgi:predicted aminopeptidase
MGRLPGIRFLVRGPINNAKLAATAFYNDLVPGFTRLFELCSGDYRRFYEAVPTSARLKPLDAPKALNAAEKCG